MCGSSGSEEGVGRRPVGGKPGKRSVGSEPLFQRSRQFLDKQTDLLLPFFRTETDRLAPLKRPAPAIWRQVRSNCPGGPGLLGGAADAARPVSIAVMRRASFNDALSTRPQHGPQGAAVRRPGWAVTVRSAKRKRGQAIENKRPREMADFAPMNDVKGLRFRRETLHFGHAKWSPLFLLVFCFVKAPRETG